MHTYTAKNFPFSKFNTKLNFVSSKEEKSLFKICDFCSICDGLISIFCRQVLRFLYFNFRQKVLKTEDLF